MKPFVVTATDTDAGKTVASALLCLGLGAAYWKPVQSGCEDPTDSETVAQLTAGHDIRIYPEAYRLQAPLSPHLAAREEQVTIDPDEIRVPEHQGPLIIEGAGGLMVPLREDLLYIDLFERWKFPVILVVKTQLGCINHTLLSVEALRRREIPIAGIVFNQQADKMYEDGILDISGLPELGRIPWLKEVGPQQLAGVWHQDWASDGSFLKLAGLREG